MTVDIFKREGFRVIITGYGLDDWIYWHFFTITIIITAQNQWLLTTRSTPYCTTSVFSTVTNAERITARLLNSATNELRLFITSRRPKYRSPPRTVSCRSPVITGMCVWGTVA
jgi:hypothetical protein